MAKQKVGEIVVDLSGVRSFVRLIGRRNSGTERGLRIATRRYLEFLRRRFRRYSMGGGSWDPLDESTVRRKAQNQDVILIEYMHLYNALNMRKLPRQLAYSVGIFSQATPYLRSDKTVEQIAEIHQTGDGLPRRTIVVRPPGGTQRGMRNDIQRGINMDVRRANRSSSRGR